MTKNIIFATYISGGCASGIIDHYFNEKMKPVRYDTFHLNQEDKRIEGINNEIYTIYTGYINLHWKNIGGFSYRLFEDNLNEFLKFNKNVNLYLILAS